MPDVDTFLAAYQVARVGADPAVVPEAGVPGGWTGLIYIRLHGSSLGRDPSLRRLIDDACRKTNRADSYVGRDRPNP